ncbi:tetratricopeptide repeat-containing sensor histidine kinase [Larkinella rosea]|uniref:histidine kinase n=1 Tax=Larkinella rosea TaxID=2025312 RepID=A0A3P1BFW1_9BACT|nr:ATP-binding protein [Larkinella rosea]RRA99934.1 histidine kinase [Larkinella rosea]
MNRSLHPALLALVSLLWGSNWMACAQSPEIDSLKRQLIQQRADTNRVRRLNRLGHLYLDIKPDTSYRLAQQAYRLAQQLDDKPGQARGLNLMGSSLSNLGDYPKAIRFFQQSLQISRSIHDLPAISSVLNNMASPYQAQKDYKRVLSLSQEAQQVFDQVHRKDTQRDVRTYAILYCNLGETYLLLNQLDSADYYLKKATPLTEQEKGRIVLDHNLYLLGDLHLKRHDTTTALSYYRRALVAAQQSNSTVTLADIYLSIASLYQATGAIDSSIVNARRALAAGQQTNYLDGILSASKLMTKLYEGRNNTQALRYFKVAVAAKDSLFSQEKIKQLLTLGFEEQQRQQEQVALEASYQNRIRLYGLTGLVAVVLLVAGLLWRTNQRQRRSNQLLTRQKTELDQQRSKAEQALGELQTTQAQLIQKEKMASLGELTAGIAHEIQNPLNFVNNFSEISGELVQELKEEASAGRLEDVLAIADDLTMNLQKINHHGKRADSIVKGMLEHSRSSTGERQVTDLNALTNEYLKLAYHGLRAKDKDFNAQLVTNFDANLSPIELVPQDMGRVLLNLYNNAFYAVAERQKTAPEGYRPKVTVSTQRSQGKVEIRVKDNGTGIPESVKAKIFQPFFTTKPTGQGTGLGLSMSYDIITNGHGGSLEVETQTGDGTEMVVRLPA